MELLVSREEVSKVFQIGAGIKVADFNRYIQEAQQHYLRKLMPLDAYYKVTSNPSNYTEVLNGVGSKTGLKDVIIQLVYAVFVLKSNTVSTTHGIVTKLNNPHSEPLGYTERRDMHLKHLEYAKELYREVAPLIKSDKCVSNIRTYKTKVIQ